MEIRLLSNRYQNDGIPALELSDIQRKYIDIFSEKIRNGVYSLRDRTCECENGNLEVIAQKDRYGIPVDTVICKNCGLIMTDPCLDDASNNSFYDNEYHYIYRDEVTPSEERFQERKSEAAIIIDFIRDHTNMTAGSVLEIGCADGGNVAAFCESGYRACGIDLSHTYVEFGKTKGLDLYCSEAASFAKQGKTFDLIVLNHVLEHFTDLKKELEPVSSMMSDEGYLFVAVPGVKYLTFGAYGADFLRMLQNAHIFNFTKATLCSTMKSHGFDCVYANEAVYAVFKKGTAEMVFDDQYSKNMEYLGTVEKASGDLQALLIARAIEELSSYREPDVILYGKIPELDALTQALPDLSPIRGFFDSEKKRPEEVVDYMIKNGMKHLVIVDSKQDKVLRKRFSDLIRFKDILLFSVYSDIF